MASTEAVIALAIASISLGLSSGLTGIKDRRAAGLRMGEPAVQVKTVFLKVSLTLVSPDPAA
jgi:hypothetical protein